MLFTIGHSTHTLVRFVELLKLQDIEVVADVRSVPASRFTPQFNGEALRDALRTHGIRYVWLEDLGGRPKNLAYIDNQGYANYEAMSQDRLFLVALGRLERGVQQFRVAAMCSEENPNECHRRLLVVRTLCQQNPAYTQQIQHIRGNQRLESELELSHQTQNNWFDEEVSLWRSPKPIPSGSLEKAQSNFLEYSN
jgi:uncharacterized protein (DUF488 family)